MIFEEMNFKIIKKLILVINMFNNFIKINENMCLYIYVYGNIILCISICF